MKLNIIRAIISQVFYSDNDSRTECETGYYYPLSSGKVIEEKKKSREKTL